VATFERFAFFTGLVGPGPAGISLSAGEFVQQLLEVVSGGFTPSSLTFVGPIQLSLPFSTPPSGAFYINPDGSVYQLTSEIAGSQYMAVIFK
jgi:hypothetical protein